MIHSFFSRSERGGLSSPLPPRISQKKEGRMKEGEEKGRREETSREENSNHCGSLAQGEDVLREGEPFLRFISLKRKDIRQLLLVFTRN